MTVAIEVVASPPETSEDRLLGGRVVLRQPSAGYRVALDTVFLAAAAPVGPGERVLDLGCGVGGAGLCLLARVGRVDVTGLEIEPSLVELARRNARLNGWAERMAVLEGDVLSPPPALAAGSFDHVICNPPYLAEAHSQPSRTRLATVANREAGARLSDWLDVALIQVRSGGSVTFVHRADRLDELLALLHGRAGGIVVFPLWPRAGRAAKRVLVRAHRENATSMRLAAGLVLHGDDGRFTEGAEAVLRLGRALEL